MSKHSSARTTPMSDAQIEAVTLGGAQRFRGKIEIATLAIEHVGSIAVPGLAAKPIIEIHLLVADAAREEAYAPRLESAGYRLTIREPDWFEHRMFKAAPRRESACVLHRLPGGRAGPSVPRLALQ